ncbi:hypothetical protein MOE57_14445 [Bacillus inaquosorum]|uniref:hypothetical protein n=1 Tax=Bacillus inaquosorum TaxID=483913 RepID=UPI00227F51D9|nr:hypothetical protein [Bacillus inaquosorum]MCY9083668.1 hypothetical protein [Bacillus inaquosorum]
MAKLEGVKTLDMVNGEITKVAYGGAAYERVGNVGEHGDIALRIAKPASFAEVGQFYPVVKEFEILRFIDDEGEKPSVHADRFVFFRKVSAPANPSVEERVAKAEGEIESLKSDVAALKGEAGYKRIGKSEAQAGDYVKFIETNDSSITVGKMYEIVNIDYEGYLDFIDDDGDKNCGVSSEVFEVYCKVSAASVEAEPKPERWKVGDYAKVVGQSIINEKGDIVKIIQDTGGNVPFKVESMDGKSTEWRSEESLVRATDEEVAEAKRAAEFAKFKEGAKVRLKSGGGELPLNGYENGKVYEILYTHLQRNRIGIIGGEITMGFATPDQLEILSEEEAVEHKKWAEIGREVGEYKKGDVVRYDYGDNEICEVVDDTEDGRVEVQTKDYGICREKPDTLRLVTPVEARFDR